ncbi:hypothetical protein D9753_16090 [Streptomyces dangxiongensis]|uniref:Uncharacterized protein n=1 Tax=Streptomyces dangxiongensis TaxID=1442032 RepID=A0A3G2JDC1_9ACTN|nr:hypothetical protein D9753_16090 [Streptomyces dangxiongensis]
MQFRDFVLEFGYNGDLFPSLNARPQRWCQARLSPHEKLVGQCCDCLHCPRSGLEWELLFDGDIRGRELKLSGYVLQAHHKIQHISLQALPS